MSKPIVSANPTPQKQPLKCRDIIKADHNRNIGSVDDLAASMSVVGQLAPILVRRLPEPRAPGIPPYEVIAGERRLAAAESLGWDEVDAVVCEADDGRAALIQISENTVRKQIAPAELAESLSRLKNAKRSDGKKWTGDAIGKAVGLTEGYVNNLIRMRQKLSPELWKMFEKLPAGSGEVRRFIEAAGIQGEAPEVYEAQAAFIEGRRASLEVAAGAGDGDSRSDDNEEPREGEERAAPLKYLITPKAFHALVFSEDAAPRDSYLRVMYDFLISGKRKSVPASFYDVAPKGKRQAREP